MNTKKIAAAAAMVSTLALGGAQQASADTVTAYLGWSTTTFSVACPRVGLIDMGLVSVSPTSHNSGWRFRNLQGGGIFETLVYNENGVTQAHKFHKCTSTSPFVVSTLTYSPTKYVNRQRYVNYSCFGGSCVPIGTTTTAWKAGTANPW